MKNKNYKTMKVFDCQCEEMPEDVQEAFFSFYECGNDVIVEWTIANEVFSTKEKPIDRGADENSEWALNKKKVDQWLIDNGAKGPKDKHSEGETVLIKHWW